MTTAKRQRVFKVVKELEDEEFGDVWIVNCTIVDNDGGIKDRTGSAGPLDRPHFDPRLVNTIIYDHELIWSEMMSGPPVLLGKNTTGIGWTTYDYGMGWNVTASHCDIEGVIWSEVDPNDGNVDAEPVFVNTAYGEYHLKSTGNSAIIDGGDNDAASSMDFDGQERIVNGGSSATVDMGCDEYNPFRVMENIEKLGNGNIKIDWNGVSGVSTYKVYLSAEEYGPYMSWSLMYTGSATDWTHDIDCEDYDFMYYKVAYTSGSNIIETDPVGFYNVEITKGAKNTVALPLIWKSNGINDGFGAVEDWTVYLTEAGSEGDADKIRWWDYENQEWQTAWLHSTGQWRQLGGQSASTIEIRPGEAFEIESIAGPGTTKITFLGYVPQVMGYSTILGTGTADDQTGFSCPYPISTNLNDLKVLYLGGKGVSSSASRDSADKIVKPDASAEYDDWSDEDWDPILWLNTDGYWYKWSDDTKTTSSDTEVKVEPGKGFYFEKADTEQKALVIPKPY